MRELVGHVVVCGLEELGLRVLEELDRLGEQVVVLAHDPEPRYVAVATRLGARIVEGDPADPEALRACGIPGARAAVFTADGDIANIHGALAAVALDPAIHVVMRAFDEEFGRSVETLIPGAVALSASSLAAPGFVSSLVDEETDRRLDMLGRDLALRYADPDDAAVLAVLADESQRPVALFPSAPPPVAGSDAGGRSRPGDGCASWMPRATRLAAVAARRTSRLPAISAPRPSMIRRVDRRFWVLATVIVVLILAAAAIFQVRRQDIGVVDAIYDAFASILGNADPVGPDHAGPQVLRHRPRHRGRHRAGRVLRPGRGRADEDAGLEHPGAARRRRAGPRHHRRLRVARLSGGYGAPGAGYPAWWPPTPTPMRGSRARLASGTSPSWPRDARSSDMLRSLRIEHARALLAATDDDAANLAIGPAGPGHAAGPADHGAVVRP